MPTLRHKLWSEGPEIFSRINRFATSVILAAIIYLVGLIIALVSDVTGSYLQSPAFILGALGIGWVFGSISARARAIDRLYADVILIFTSPSNAIRPVIQYYFDVASRKRYHALASLLLFFALCCAAYVAFFNFPLKLGIFELTSLRPMWFSLDLYLPDSRWSGFLLVVVFALGISTALGLALWLVLSEMRALRRLVDFPVPPLPEAIRAKLRPIADFHAAIARDWSLGALLFVALFAGRADAGSIGFTSLVLAIGLVVFVVPQVYLRRIVLQAHRRAADVTLAAWRQKSETSSAVADTGLPFLVMLNEVSAPPSYWVYGSGQVIMWTIAQTTAMAALALQASGTLHLAP